MVDLTNIDVHYWFWAAVTTGAICYGAVIFLGCCGFFDPDVAKERKEPEEPVFSPGDQVMVRAWSGTGSEGWVSGFITDTAVLFGAEVDISGHGDNYGGPLVTVELSDMERSCYRCSRRKKW